MPTQKAHEKGSEAPEALQTRAKTITRCLERWEQLWALPGLAGRVRVQFSSRLRSSWGRAYPRRGLITLASSLRAAPSRRLQEVLCHEVAHVAVHWKYGPGVRPHGREWEELVRAAGLRPMRRLAGEARAQAARAASTYEHRCPVCQALRLSKRPMQAWRCAACTRAGLPGLLTITRLTPER